MLNVLDLFSGVGNFSLGLHRAGGFRTVGFCEIDTTCHPVLQRHFPGVPIHQDITRLRGEDLLVQPDVVCGGFPTDLARTSQSTELPPALPGSDPASGSNTCASSKKRTRTGSSSKTSRPFALADWKKCSGGSLRSGTLLAGTVFPQAPLVLLTKGTESGLLPTVRASEYKGCGPKGSRSHSHWLAHFYLSAIVTDSGKLNPTFAERLMGMPADWTDV